MKHERLTVDLYRYPLNIPIESRITNIDSNHKPLDGSITKWFPDCVVVEITSCQLTNVELGLDILSTNEFLD